MGSFLKGLAIAVGTGLAACALLSKPRSRKAVRNPLEDRVDGLETRVHAMEQPAPEPPAIADFDERLQSQESEIRALRIDVNETDRRITAQMDFVERRFRELNDEIPTLVEAGLNARLGPLEARLEREIETRHQQSLLLFERTIDEKVTQRISSLERTLLDQSVAIGALRERAEATEQNLQRLVNAVERLCERDQPAPEPLAQPALSPFSFQAQLDDAIQRPNMPPPPGQEFRPRLVREGEPEDVKPRVPMARILVALMAFGISRVLR